MTTATASNPSFAQLCRSPSLLLAFGFGSGLSPIAPGTVGTLMALPLLLLLREVPGWLYLPLVVFAFAVGVKVCSSASKQLGVHDHGGIVWDEMVGYWLTMWLAPPAWWWLIVGFLLFRLFDIVKPWPVSVADKKITGGLGIMVDDILAAVYALIALQLIAWLVVGYNVFA